MVSFGIFGGSYAQCKNSHFWLILFKDNLVKYKCSINNNNFKLVNEYYTSKTCSLCGNYNNKLEGNKIYNCKNCNSSIDRDINGCRNIYMKQFMKEIN